jgi:prolipoprotein diacylglyceryltransferase
VRPILFQLRGVRIHAYSVFLFIGLTLGVIAGTEAGKSLGLDPLRLYAALVLLTIPALVGSRLLFVLTHWDRFRGRGLRIWSGQAGGASLYGGLILALACSLGVIPLFGLTIGAFWDAATITLLVGMVVTKIGCLLEGCCAGRKSEGWLTMYLPNAGGEWCRRIPSQLLECALAAGLLVVVASVRTPANGTRFLLALAIYSVARLPLGATREAFERVGKIRIDYAISCMLAVWALVTLYAINR